MAVQILNFRDRHASPQCMLGEAVHASAPHRAPGAAARAWGACADVARHVCDVRDARRYAALRDMLGSSGLAPACSPANGSGLGTQCHRRQAAAQRLLTQVRLPTRQDALARHQAPRATRDQDSAPRVHHCAKRSVCRESTLHALVRSMQLDHKTPPSPTRHAGGPSTSWKAPKSSPGGVCAQLGVSRQEGGHRQQRRPAECSGGCATHSTSNDAHGAADASTDGIVSAAAPDRPSGQSPARYAATTTAGDATVGLRSNAGVRC